MVLERLERFGAQIGSRPLVVHQIAVGIPQACVYLFFTNLTMFEFFIVIVRGVDFTCNEIAKELLAIKLGLARH
jgi:hypothetical protein